LQLTNYITYYLKLITMSYENYPSVDGSQNNYPQKNNSSNGKNILIGLLGFGLLGSLGYNYYQNNKAKTDIAQKDAIINTESTEKEQLQKELDDAAFQFDELKSEDAKKDSSLTAKDREIAETRNKIQQILSKSNASKAELSQAKTLIKQLNGTIAGYKEEITTLKLKNAALTSENEVVTNEKNSAIEERDKKQKDLDLAQEDVKQKEKLIDAGSTLHASNFSIVGINEKSGGKEKETSTAKRVDKLRIAFDIDENMITQSGKKDLFICITAPDGTPVTVQALGSGTFTIKNGNTLNYTQKSTIDYIQNTKIPVKVEWKQNSDFQRGNYKIEVYNNGYKIGEGYRELKKGGLFG
jgi:hypothetical protein